MQTVEDGVAKWFRRFGLFSLVVIVLPFTAYTQSFEDFKTTQASSFKKFQDENDNKFASYLKEQWRDFEAYRSLKLFEKPKPKHIEQRAPLPIKEIGPRVDIAIPKNIKPQKQKRFNPQVQQDDSVDFFGTYIGFDVDDNIKQARFFPTDQTGVITFFNVMASSDYASLVTSIKEQQVKLHLNDWGVFELVTLLSHKIYANKDDQNLFRWFFLNKLGFDVKIGSIENHVVLLIHSVQIIYATPRYKLGGSFYYAIDYVNDTTLGRVYTYDKKYPNAEKTIDFQLHNLPVLEEKPFVKTLHFNDPKGVYHFKVTLNKNLLDFFNTYPQVDYNVYFNAPFDSNVYAQLATQIRNYINGVKASYALNYTLRFVQKSFGYERDQEQFGKEKVMFAEETLYYDKSDCEDRAILFAKLVKKMFGYSVVGLKYKDHMSTALAVPMNGDFVKLGTHKYVVADPTYINANIGMAMPKYKNIIPEQFIRLR